MCYCHIYHLTSLINRTISRYSISLITNSQMANWNLISSTASSFLRLSWCVCISASRLRVILSGGIVHGVGGILSSKYDLSSASNLAFSFFFVLIDLVDLVKLVFDESVTCGSFVSSADVDENMRVNRLSLLCECVCVCGKEWTRMKGILWLFSLPSIGTHQQIDYQSEICHWNKRTSDPGHTLIGVTVETSFNAKYMQIHTKTFLQCV